MSQIDRNLKHGFMFPQKNKIDKISKWMIKPLSLADAYMHQWTGRGCGLVPNRRQAITWSSVGLLSLHYQEEISVKIQSK